VQEHAGKFPACWLVFTVQNMNYQIIKLDDTHDWHQYFNYVIEFTKSNFSTGVLEFDQTLRWFNATWGWSQDVQVQEDIRDTLAGSVRGHDLNPLWAYSMEYKNYRIYCKTDRELAYFQLCHVQNNI